MYLDLNGNSLLDVGEPEMQTSADFYYTPAVDEAGAYSFTHLAQGIYAVRQIVPAVLSATPATEREHVVTIAAAENHPGVNFADVYRRNEIHGTQFDDANGNHLRDLGEAGTGGVTIFVDLDRDNSLDAGEPTTVTLADGSYSFTNMSPGAYVIREVVSPGYTQTSPTTVGGILWPTGVSNPAVGNVSPLEITTSLAMGETHRQTVSLTLPTTGALTNLVDVFLLFDDTGSFVRNSPIVRAAFPDIIAQLQALLTGIDLGFGVGRLEEYGNFASEYSTGRPFVLNQPIVAASTSGYMTAIQAALNRTTPGYGGDQPETDIEALYQLVTGLGFDGNNNGSVLDSGAAGLASTQLNPGGSGDVPSFASFTADPASSVMPAAGNLGGGGFRAGALPIVLLATDTGFAYQPMGETSVTGVGGLTLPVSSLTETSRATTPFNSGAGLQQTITGLNALGALVIGLGTNPQATLDPRQGLESLSKLTGATNQSTATIANGTADPIAPGDPFYFQIASGFGASVANGIVSAIQNAVTNVAMDVTIQASDPRVHIINHTGVLHGLGAGAIANFDIEFQGDGIPHRFDLQFVRAGTNVVLGSIPVVIGTPIPGDGYEFEDLEDGEICDSVDFGNMTNVAATVVGRSIFYNQSSWDGNSALINAVNDNAAIAPDKTAYLPGAGVAVAANITSFSRGINGMIVDLSTGVNHAGITASDFTFKVGNNNTPNTWAAAPAPSAISVIPGGGVGGADRVEITWTTGTITNQWLEVQVLATVNTGLADTDVHFWGNKIADSGTTPGAGTFNTTSTDAAQVFATIGAGKPITDLRDYNRDGAVTSTDAAIVFANIGTISRISISGGGPFAPEADPAVVVDDGSSAVASALAGLGESNETTIQIGDLGQLHKPDHRSGWIPLLNDPRAVTGMPPHRRSLASLRDAAHDLSLDDGLLDYLLEDIRSGCVTPHTR
jgi:hypothetical protein